MAKFAHMLQPGDHYEPLEFVVSPELNQQYLFAQEDFDPRYVTGRGSKPPEVHPTLLLSMSANTKSPGFRLAPGTGSILGEQTCEFLNPAYTGKRLRVTWRVVETYEKRGRSYQVAESSIVDEDGVEILRRRSHLTFPRTKRDAARPRRRRQ